MTGREVRGLLKQGPAGAQQSRPLVPEPLLVDLAVEVGGVLGLDINGVDVVGTSHPSVVDVNAFDLRGTGSRRPPHRRLGGLGGGASQLLGQPVVDHGSEPVGDVVDAVDPVLDLDQGGVRGF